MRTVTFAIFFVILVLGGLAFLSMQDPDVAQDLARGVRSTRTSIHLRPTLALSVEVANTDAARVKGLSGRDPLPENQGLLFVFEEDGYPAIWMKDMRFAIDIIWINREGEIVHIEESVTPGTYPRTFKPAAPARYVVEVNAGYADARNVRVGDQTDVAQKYPPRDE